MQKNQKALDAINDQIQGDSLCHMTDAEKKAYNAEYYRNHKNYWQDYYSKGQTVGRPMARPKNVTEGNGQGVKRRGEGLNGNKLTIPGVQHVSTIGSLPMNADTAGQTDEWYQNHMTTTTSNVQVNIPGEAFVKKHAKQLASDIKTGRKAMADAGKQFVKDWISGAKSLFEKKPVVVTNTWSGTAGGQHVSGSNSFVLRGKKKK